MSCELWAVCGLWAVANFAHFSLLISSYHRTLWAKTVVRVTVVYTKGRWWCNSVGDVGIRYRAAGQSVNTHLRCTCGVKPKKKETQHTTTQPIKINHPPTHALTHSHSLTVTVSGCGWVGGWVSHQHSRTFLCFLPHSLTHSLTLTHALTHSRTSLPVHTHSLSTADWGLVGWMLLPSFVHPSFIRHSFVISE